MAWGCAAPSIFFPVTFLCTTLSFSEISSCNKSLICLMFSMQSLFMNRSRDSQLGPFFFWLICSRSSRSYAMRLALRSSCSLCWSCQCSWSARTFAQRMACSWLFSIYVSFFRYTICFIKSFLRAQLEADLVISRCICCLKWVCSSMIFCLLMLILAKRSFSKSLDLVMPIAAIATFFSCSTTFAAQLSFSWTPRSSCSVSFLIRCSRDSISNCLS